MNQFVTLRGPSSFSLKATALSHGWHECAPMGWCEGGRCLQLVERFDGRAGRLTVRQAESTGDGSEIAVTIEGAEGDPDAAARVVADLRVTLGLDHDLSEFYELCAAHPALRVVPRIGAGRILRSASMTENILKALFATNVNWTQAVKMINRLCQLGPVVPHFRNLSAWPTPREILRAGRTYLVEVCRAGYRADSILRFCREVCDGRIDPEGWTALARDPAVSSDELLTLLRGIHGIGPSSAHYLLGFLGRHDRLSIDSATVAHVAATHTRGRRPTHREIERIYAPYGKWRNLVYWCESWLTWGTAREILREAGMEAPPPTRGPRRSPRRK
ncbi:MAG: hypothetical protein HY763_01800 [Planctomycetes bacterium]|nr:hypothetical protein [Planctomycetota bacterium]